MITFREDERSSIRNLKPLKFFFFWYIYYDPNLLLGMTCVSARRICITLWTCESHYGFYYSPISVIFFFLADYSRNQFIFIMICRLVYNFYMTFIFCRFKFNFYIIFKPRLFKITSVTYWKKDPVSSVIYYSYQWHVTRTYRKSYANTSSTVGMPNILLFYLRRFSAH